MLRIFIMSLPPFALRASSAAAWLCLVCGVLSASAFAQTTTLAPVMVTGSREPAPINRLVGDVSVIDAEHIRASTADSIEELLQREGGIQVSRNGGAGQSAGVMLRGSSASSTVVLIDGVRIGSATLGQTDLSGISLAQIERIEILRGPASSLYGADAVGGVVQIITRRGKGPVDVAVHAAIGAYASSELDVFVSGSSGAFDYAATLSHEASDGVSALKPGDKNGYFNPDRDGFKRSSAQFRGGFIFAPGHRVGISMIDSRLRSQFDSADFDPSTNKLDPTPDFRNRFDTRVTSLDYRGAISTEWTMSVQASKQIDRLESGGTTFAGFDTSRQQLTWQAAWAPVAGQQFVAASERLDETVAADALAGAPKRRNDAVVLGYSGAFAGHKLQADVRHDHNSAFGNVDTGKLGWGFDLTPTLSLRAVAGTAFRAPSFNDLYFSGFGVATIRPERSQSVEVGANWRDGDSTAGITLYRNRVRDLIGYEPLAANCPPGFTDGCAANVSRARLQGATLNASQRVGAFSLRATVDFLDAKDDITGKRLARRAAHQETLGVDWSSGQWIIGATVVDVGARPDGAATLDAYQTLDLQARYKATLHCQIEAKLLNATNRQYEPAHDYQSFGRQAWIGVRYSSVGL
jgi:vitamin B12 transporter